ncbi:MAG: LysR substrate-binding domain-containing protein, partial [Pseudomonadota bacterium]
MASPTIRQLRYFDALARHAHFGRAARASAISQPALSMQIRELEDALGVVLIERGARQFNLTHVGEVVAERATAILRDIDELSDLARASHDHLVGRLRLGIIPTVGPYLLPATLARLTETHPSLDTLVRETTTERLIEELREGKLDAAILALPVSEPSLEEIALFEEPFVLVRPAADRDAPLPDATSLGKMRLLLLEEGHCFRAQALSFCSQPTARPHDLLDASSLATLVQMVAAGFGVTLLPEMAVATEARSADVAISRFAAPEPKRAIGMVWRKSNPL